MDYFSLLNLQCEPFSNSPDPAFFYPSPQHQGCLQQLELAIRLRRGLNVVIGDVGTGKTTLCRDLIRRFAKEAALDTYLMLDPGASTDRSLLARVLALFTGRKPRANWDEDRLKEAIKQFLFEKGVDEGHTVTLIIDEGQKLSSSSLEILREFLNFETNRHKLLQMVIFAQKEFDQSIAMHPNFADRINLRIVLNPLSFRDTLALIRHRIQVAGGAANRLFSLPAVAAIYLATNGYPRRIIHLGHRILLALIIQDRRRAGWRLAGACARRAVVSRKASSWPRLAAVGALLLAAIFVLAPPAWSPQPTLTGTSPSTGITATPASEAITQAAPGGFGDPQAPSPYRPGPSPVQAETSVNHNGEPSTVIAAAGPAADPVSKGAQPAVMTMPARLGRLTIAPRETLGQLIEMIYGRYSPAYLDVIVEANPHIPNPDRLDVGDVIHFPALPMAVRPPTVNVWWVQLGAFQQLDIAVQALKGRQRNGIAARLISYWNPDGGLTFALVLTECFYDRRTAEKACDQFIAPADQPAEIRALWRDDTVFFSDPFQTVAGIPENHLQAKRGRRAR